MMPALCGLGLALLLFFATAASTDASTITTYTSLGSFTAAATGPLTTEDFGPDAAFPITTGVLSSDTDLDTAVGDINPGDLEPGVTYSTQIGSGFFFNIDEGGGFTDGFLDSLSSTNTLSVAFDSPASAFAFDTNYLMGSEFVITINFLSGAAYQQTFGVQPTTGMQFFGFIGSAADITSAVIAGNDGIFGFAVDNFVFNSPEVTPVPEPASLTLLGLGLAGMGARRWRQCKQ